MPMTKVLVALAIVAATVVVALAGPAVTVVLTNGQRYNGSLLSRDNRVSLTLPDGKEMSWQQSEVAAIQFDQAQPNASELAALSSAMRTAGASGTSAVALRGGKVVVGRIEAIAADGERVTVATSSSGRQSYAAGDIKYLYVNPQSAETLFTPDTPAPSSQPPSGATGTSGQQAVARETSTPLGAARVSGRQLWSPTSVVVRQGDRLVFRASGQVSWAAEPHTVAGPNGSPTDPAAASRYPVPSLGVGALIGRVGNGEPFPIGASSEPIAMPSDGRLYLGINDDAVNDNGGTFVVQIARIGR